MLEHDQLYQHLENSPEVSRESGAVTGMLHGELFKISRVDKRGDCNFTLFWNTHGVSVFKSYPISAWTVHCIIPDLPLRLQKKFKVLTTL